MPGSRDGKIRQQRTSSRTKIKRTKPLATKGLEMGVTSGRTDSACRTVSLGKNCNFFGSTGNAQLRKCAAQIFFELGSRLLVALVAFQLQRIMEPTVAISSRVIVDTSLPHVPALSALPSSRSVFRPFAIGRDDFDDDAMTQFSLQ